jgi:hypothetical protein
MDRAQRRWNEINLECQDLKEYSRLLEGEVEQASRAIADKDATLAQTRRQLDDERAQVGVDDGRCSSMCGL